MGAEANLAETLNKPCHSGIFPKKKIYFCGRKASEMEQLKPYIETIKALCAKHKVARLYAFGSVLTPRFGHESDFDFAVEFTDVDLMDYADNYFDLKFSLEDLFRRKVDLIEEKALKNKVFIENMSQNKQLLYAA